MSQKLVFGFEFFSRNEESHNARVSDKRENASQIFNQNLLFGYSRQ